MSDLVSYHFTIILGERETRRGGEEEKNPFPPAPSLPLYPSALYVS
jgi:hypothetical protein